VLVTDVSSKHPQRRAAAAGEPQAATATSPAAALALSVVVPTFNERANVAPLIDSLEVALDGIAWELVVVDDASPDGTAEAVRALARTDRRVRLIARHNRRGLSSAVVEGALAAAADIVAVMDGDLQHDEAVLPALYREVAAGRAEIASASRFLTEDGAAGLSSARRVRISNAGITLANRAFGLDLTDPLTGFFVMRREVLLRALPNLSEQGFKILLDIIAGLEPRPRVVEFPFRFRARLHGDSKLDSRVIYDFFLFFLEKRLGRFVPVPPRFLSFSLVNGVGIFVHLAVLTLVMGLFGMTFAAGQLTATLVAMFFNFSVNNALTYRDRQLRGTDFYLGFAAFAALCSIGVFGNLGVATMLHEEYSNLAHAIPALAGALITLVWNYGVTKVFIWGRRKPSAAFLPAGAAGPHEPNPSPAKSAWGTP
jgi:dolichol-phosphate mannosyltransferase